jgi:hypothetical protein
MLRPQRFLDLEWQFFGGVSQPFAGRSIRVALYKFDHDIRSADAEFSQHPARAGLGESLLVSYRCRANLEQHIGETGKVDIATFGKFNKRLISRSPTQSFALSDHIAPSWNSGA